MRTMKVVELALELTPVPMLLASAQGDIVLANDEMAELFGYAAGRLNGSPISRLVPPDVRSAHGHMIEAFMRVPAKRVMGRGRSVSGVTKSGELVPLELGLNAIDVDGATYSLVVAIDLRQRIVAQNRVEQAMEAAATAMIMVAEDGTISMANRAAECLTGYSREEMLGREIEMLMPKQVRLAHQVYRQNFPTMADQDRMKARRVVQVGHSDGTEIPVEIALTTVDSAPGRQVMCTLIDLRDRIASEAAIQERNTRLTEANHELVQFGYAVSHDLKAPLASLQGLLGIARQAIGSGDVAAVAPLIDRAVDLCARHSVKVEKILSLTARDAEPEILMVDVPKLVTTIWEGIAPSVTCKVRFRTDFGVDAFATNEVMLEVVLQNLLSNAAKYTDPAKTTAEISVASRKRKGGIILSVADNGVGIAQEHHAAVFEMFRRLDRRCGDGIGLALVQKQVQRLGGRIELTSEPGKGSTFNVFFPHKECS